MMIDVDFAAAKNLVISSSYYPCKEVHKQTWRSTDGKTNNHIDHTLTKRLQAVYDVKSCRGANHDSDHFLVKGKYSCKTGYRKHEINRNPNNVNVERQNLV
jgi:hypothetical protein